MPTKPATSQVKTDQQEVKTSELDNAKPVQFHTTDGFVLKGTFYPARQAVNNISSEQKFLIIGSAFGVPQQYYKHVALYFAKHGINCISFDYRGINDSYDSGIDHQHLQIKDWGIEDVNSVIKSAKQEYAADKIYYLGHSCGGQIVGLAEQSVELDKIILAATGVGSWQKWPGLYKYGIWLVWKLLFPISMFFRRKAMYRSTLLGPLPVPRVIVEQWLNWARSEHYLFSAEHGLDVSYYKKIDADLLKVSLTDDLYAPKGAMDELARYYSNSSQRDIYLSPAEIGLKKVGHFGLFRKKTEIKQGIWQPMLNFLQDKS